MFYFGYESRLNITSCCFPLLKIKGSFLPHFNPNSVGNVPSSMSTVPCSLLFVPSSREPLYYPPCCIPLINEYQATFSVGIFLIINHPSVLGPPLGQTFNCFWKNTFYVQFCSTYVNNIISQYIRNDIWKCSVYHVTEKAYRREGWSKIWVI